MPILHPSLFFQKTPMLFVVVFLLVGILIPDRSLSYAAVFVVGPKAPMSFVVSDWDSYWLHVDIQMAVL